MNETDAPPEWARKEARDLVEFAEDACGLRHVTLENLIRQRLTAARALGWRDAIVALRETNYNHMVDGPKTSLHHMREHAALWLEANTDLQHALADPRVGAGL